MGGVECLVGRFERLGPNLAVVEILLMLAELRLDPVDVAGQSKLARFVDIKREGGKANTKDRGNSNCEFSEIPSLKLAPPMPGYRSH